METDRPGRSAAAENGAARAREQRVMQHAQEDAAAGLCGWQIEGRHAQRLDEFIEQALWQTAADIGNGCSICAAKALKAPAQGTAQQGGTFAQRPAAGAGNADQGVQRRGQVGKDRPLPSA
jgi:hypothetical protein